LIQLRHLESSLSDGRLNCVHVTCDENERWLVLERGEITVACNFGTRYHHIPLGLDRHKLILASEANIHGGNGINFPPESVAIFKQTSLAVR
jgi:maltooligosyltrehalose trehalohydrolase